MKKLLIIVVFFLIPVSYIYSQGEIDEQQKIFFRNERSGAWSQLPYSKEKGLPE